MKIKTPDYFSGVKCIKDHSLPTKSDFKYAKISKGLNWTYCYRQFHKLELKKDEIDVEDVYWFCGLVRFLYKGYCCAINERDFIKSNDNL